MTLSEFETKLIEMNCQRLQSVYVNFQHTYAKPVRALEPSKPDF